MASRLDLHRKLVELLGSDNVYYQPPEPVKMSYPAIRYSLKDIEKRSANDTSYMKTRHYEITVIDTKPDHAVIDKILSLPMSDYDRHYVSDNLNHDILTLYY